MSTWAQSLLDRDVPACLPITPVDQDSWRTLPEWQVFETTLEETLQRLCAALGPSPNFLLKSRGKKVRPLLVFAANSLFQSPGNATVRTALAAELIHLASLVHDDVIDSAELRRRHPTVNSIHGNYSAVLLGDLLFAEAFRLLASAEQLDELAYFIAAIQTMCQGEIEQDQQRFHRRSVAAYLHYAAGKTASLLGACCRAGAAAGRASQDAQEQLGLFGEHLGLAFQIADDIRDCTGSVQTLGKEALNDLREGNYTLPLILLLDDPLYGPWLHTATSEGLTPTVAQQLPRILAESGALAQATDLARHYVGSAKAQLAQFPDSPAKTFLALLADQVMSPA